MPVLLVTCPEHGTFSSGIAVSNSTGVTFHGNHSACPVCHRLVPLADGTFDFGDDLETILFDHSRTRAELRRLRRALKEAAAIVEDRPEEAFRHLAEEDPRMAAALASQAERKGWSRSEIIALLSLLVGILTVMMTGASFYIDQQSTPDLNVNELRELLREGLDEQSPDDPPTSPPASPELPMP